jgi:predicted permease
LLLLIVCANVASLQLARAVSRQKEFSVRLALGASPRRLARQILTETLLLAIAGALLGILLIPWMGQALALLLPPSDLPLQIGSEWNVGTRGFTMLAALLTTVMSGTAPALLSMRTGLNETLNEGGRGGSADKRSLRTQGALVMAEVAMAAIAIIGAGLFYRSFQNAGKIDPGFDRTNVSVAQFYLTNSGYSAAEQRQFCRSLRVRLEAMPGVIGVSYTDAVPLAAMAGTSPADQLVIDGYTPAPLEQMLIHRATVPPGYLRLMRIPLLAGRDFTERDEAGAPNVVIVNRTFARRFFGAADPIGRKLTVGSARVAIVGVAADSKYHSPLEEPLPYFFLPFQQWFAPGLNFSILLKTVGDPMRFMPVLRRAALDLNPDAVFRGSRLAEIDTAPLYPQKVAASLLGALAIVCLLLAAVGLYGVMSYAVSRRTRELGIRMALGAARSSVLRLVTRNGLAPILPGLLAGLICALAVSRMFAGMLVEVGAADPVTFVLAAGFLTFVALLACCVPAWRATRLDPVRALHCE